MVPGTMSVSIPTEVGMMRRIRKSGALHQVQRIGLKMIGIISFGIRGLVLRSVQVTLFLLFSLIIINNDDQPFTVEVCKTWSGDICVFPFTYLGTQHDGCITHDNDGTPWCNVGNGKKGNCTSTSCPGNIMLIVQFNNNHDQS